METQTRLSRRNKFISAENIVGIFSVLKSQRTHADIYIYIYIITIYSLEFFLYQRKLKVFHGILNDSKSPQVSRTLLIIQAIFSYYYFIIIII